MRWVCLGELPFEIGPTMIDKPISELIPVTAVDHWLRFDNLAQDWRALSLILGVNLPKLRLVNASNTDFDAVSEYTPALLEMVIQRFSEDFEIFGYSTDYQCST